MNRGGSFGNDARNARSAYRNNAHPSNRNHNLGFRAAKASHRPIAAATAGPVRPDRGAVPVMPRSSSRAGSPGRNDPGRRGW